MLGEDGAVVLGLDEIPETAQITKPELVVSRNKWGRSIHQYRYDGETFPSVTGILGTLKPWALVNAAVKEALWVAVKERSQFYAIAEGSESAAVETYKGAHFKAWNAKRDHGINVHAFIAAPDVEPTKKEAPYIAQYHRWLTDTGAKVIGQEFEVVHPKFGYGGKVDFDCVLDREVTSVDIKVRDDLRTFPDRMLQVAAYAAAPIGHPESPVTRAGTLTIGHDGYSFDEVSDIPAALEAFVGLRAYFGWLQEVEE